MSRRLSALVARVAGAVRTVRRQPPSMRRAYVIGRLDSRMPQLRGASVVAAVAGVRRRPAAALLREPDAFEIDRLVAKAEAGPTAGIPALGTLRPDEGHVIYALVRALRPELVVETGVASGSSTSYLLAALARNGHGNLISIDLPFVGLEREPVVPGTEIDQWQASPIPPGREPGWIVPERLRDRWELQLGDARELLPALADPVGLFFHDSLHTRGHMLFEFEQAWRLLVPGGVLASDDVFFSRHDALPSFAAAHGRGFRTFSNLGFVGR